MLAEPDTLTQWRPVVPDIEPADEEVPNRQGDHQLNSPGPVCLDNDDAVTVPLADRVDASDPPSVDVVCGLSGVDTVVCHYRPHSSRQFVISIRRVGGHTVSKALLSGVVLLINNAPTGLAM